MLSLAFRLPYLTDEVTTDFPWAGDRGGLSFVLNWKFRSCQKFNPGCIQSLNRSKLSGNYMTQLSYQSVTLFRIYGFCMVITANSHYFLKQR
jgi:hypothetical protein